MHLVYFYFLFFNCLPRPPEKQSFRTDGATVFKKVKIQKNTNGELDERLPSLFRYVEKIFATGKQRQGNKQEQSESKNMASADHFQALFSYTSP